MVALRRRGVGHPASLLPNNRSARAVLAASGPAPDLGGVRSVTIKLTAAQIAATEPDDQPPMISPPTSSSWPAWYVTMIGRSAGERLDEAVVGDHRVADGESVAPANASQLGVPVAVTTIAEMIRE